MTRNQISYWQNVETQRTNKANEAIKEEANRVNLMNAQSNALQAQAARQGANSRDIANLIDVYKWLTSMVLPNAAQRSSNATDLMGNFMKSVRFNF